MSIFNRSYSPIPLLLLVLAILFTQIACSENQREAVGEVTQAISNKVDESLEMPDDLVFSGQVSDGNGLWLNNYVIVLFKNGKEIARTHTKLHDSPLSGKGPMDGVFELRFTNEYKLTTEHNFYEEGLALPMIPINGMMGQAYIGTWFDLKPDTFRVIEVPEKQLVYALVVLEMPLNELSTDYQHGNLTFEERKLIINLQENQPELVEEHIEAVATPVPTAVVTVQTDTSSVNKPAPQSSELVTVLPIQSNPQLTVLPSQNNGQDWHVQLSGYYGNRWDVWETYVIDRGINMSWEAFREAVLAHNPHLEADGFVFYPDKAYRLPAS